MKYHEYFLKCFKKQSDNEFKFLPRKFVGENFSKLINLNKWIKDNERFYFKTERYQFQSYKTMNFNNFRDYNQITWNFTIQITNYSEN